MRKLLLASFKHSNGVDTFEEQRIVAIDSTPNESFENDLNNAIKAVQKWFPEDHPESKLLSVMCYPTIDGTKPKKELLTFEYGAYSAHEFNEVPPKYKEGMSRILVIDMDGKRKNFQMAFYDFDVKEWFFPDNADTSLLERKHAKWMDILPFADR